MASISTILNSKTPALVMNRNILKKEQIVYVLIVNKRLNYKNKQSRIIYIGSTKKGSSRVAESIASKGEDALKNHGITKVEAYIFECKAIENKMHWKELETALILKFREIYGEAPKHNIKNAKSKISNQFQHFTNHRLETILKQFEK